MRSNLIFYIWDYRWFAFTSFAFFLAFIITVGENNVVIAFGTLSLLVNPIILCDLQTLVSSLPPIRTDDCVYKSKAVNTVRIPWEIIIPCQLMKISQTQVGTLEGQLYKDYHHSRLFEMSQLMGPGFPAMKQLGGNMKGGRKNITTDNPFVRRVLDECRTQGLANSEVLSKADEWIELFQHADTLSISNPRSNVDVVRVLKTLGLGVSQKKKRPSTSHLYYVGVFSSSEAKPIHVSVARGCNGQKKGTVWLNGGMRVQKSDGVWRGWQVRLETDKVLNNLHPIPAVDIFSELHELAREHVKQCKAGFVPKPIFDFLFGMTLVSWQTVNLFQAS